jgi:hypothetical protein
MAVLASLPGLRVEIVVDGVALAEYENEEAIRRSPKSSRHTSKLNLGQDLQ